MESWIYLLATLKPINHLVQAWNCCLTNWTFVISSLQSPPRCVLPLSSRDVPHLIPWVDLVIFEMILSCSNLKKIDSSKILPFFSLSCWVKISKAKTSRSTYAMNQQPYDVQPGSRRLCWSCAPSVFLPHVLNLGTRFLFSGGELSQP